MKKTIRSAKHHDDASDNRAQIAHRIARAAGHLQAIEKMVQEQRDCSDVLIQLSAVRAAINNIGRLVLKNHLEHCVVQALEGGNQRVLEDLNNALARFLK